MRDLVFKDLTSLDKQRRILVSSETVDKKGVRSIIHRHFVCILKEINNPELSRPLPYLYVLKKQNTIKQEEKFFFRIKGSLHAVINGRLFLILFMHSLRIGLMPVPVGVSGI
jgi:hypothetical protein